MEGIIVGAAFLTVGGGGLVILGALARRCQRNAQRIEAEHRRQLEEELARRRRLAQQREVDARRDFDATIRNLEREAAALTQADLHALDQTRYGPEHSGVA